MSYIGNQISTAAFLTDTFSGDGSTTAFTMQVAPATTTSMLVAISGVLQSPDTYSIVGTTLNFTGAPPIGTNNISIRYLGIPASGVTQQGYRTLTEFTATSGQTTFTPSASYTVGYVNVYRNGVRLGSTDFTASNGTTVVLASGATAGDLVDIESFYVSNLLNVIPANSGAVVSSYLATNLTLSGTTTANTITSAAGSPLTLQSNGGSTAITVDTSQNVGIGTASPSGRNGSNRVLQVSTANEPEIKIATTGAGQNAWLSFSPTASSGDAWISNIVAGSNLIFANGGYTTERMRIDSSGNLGVGTTSASAKIDVLTSGNGTGFLSENSNQATTGNYLYWGYASSATRFVVYGNGGIANYQANNVNLSDKNVKKDFASAKSYLDTICAIPVQTFRYIDQQDDELNLGVVAQDVQAVAPELVTEVNWGTKEDPKMCLSIYQTDLQYALMKAIQELNAKVDAQAAEIAALQAKVGS